MNHATCVAATLTVGVGVVAAVDVVCAQIYGGKSVTKGSNGAHSNPLGYISFWTSCNWSELLFQCRRPNFRFRGIISNILCSNRSYPRSEGLDWPLPLVV